MGWYPVMAQQVAAVMANIAILMAGTTQHKWATAAGDGPFYNCDVGTDSDDRKSKNLW
jgi:hypothetical protein